MSNRRKPLATFFGLLFMGLAAFSNIASKPRFETFHRTDVLQLICSGMCFGVAFVALVNFIRGPRSL